MVNSLEHREDGSIALWINGDLQFDSKDEHIYHETLTVPALSIGSKRKQNAVNVLIIGGGDGLVARELFKSALVNSVDLVDYDPEILSFAKIDLAKINDNSLSDPRLTIHIRDAWEYVDEAIAKNLNYDIIISDLTVAEDISDARFHSIDWYNKLSQLLATNGILAVNAVSPSATPEAYWSIFNSILKGGLHPRPYHAHIPSFTTRGYGQTWGRFIASAKMIQENELHENTGSASLAPTIPMDLFLFPQELFEYQKSSLPALAGSDILLHYFANASVCETNSGILVSSFAMDTQALTVPEADTGKKILPPELRTALAQSLSNNEAAAIDPQSLFQDVLQLMPSLQREHTPEIIADFLEDPGHFLEAIDIPQLVLRLLQRAKELPAQVVAELRLLAEKLNEWAGDHLSLLNLGRRVITILTLVIVVGNLLYPDTVYGKGDHGHRGTHASAHASAHANTGRARGRRGRGGWVGGTSGGGTYWNTYNRRVPGKTVTTQGVTKKAPAPAQTKNYNYGKGGMQKAPATTGMITPTDNVTLVTYLSTVVRDADATRNRLLRNQSDYTAYSEMLKQELNAYENAAGDSVNYGSHRLPKAEAIRRAQLSLKRTITKIDSLATQIEQLPAHIDLAKIALDNLTENT